MQREVGQQPLSPVGGPPGSVRHTAVQERLANGCLIDRHPSKLDVGLPSLLSHDRVLGPGRVAAFATRLGLPGQPDAAGVEHDGLIEAAQELLMDVATRYEQRPVAAQPLGQLRVGKGDANLLPVRTRRAVVAQERDVVPQGAPVAAADLGPSYPGGAQSVGRRG